LLETRKKKADSGKSQYGASDPIENDKAEDDNKSGESANDEKSNKGSSEDTSEEQPAKWARKTLPTMTKGESIQHMLGIGRGEFL
jgi:hypothetical protein